MGVDLSLARARPAEQPPTHRGTVPQPEVHVLTRRNTIILTAKGLAALLTVSPFLTACTPDAPEPEDDTGDAEPSPDEAEAPEDPTEDPVETETETTGNVEIPPAPAAPAPAPESDSDDSEE